MYLTSEKVRFKLVDYTISILALFVFPVLGILFWHFFKVGWSLVFMAHMLVAFSVLMLFLLRSTLGFLLKSSWLVVNFFFIYLLGVYFNSLVPVGTTTVAVLAIITILFGLRWGGLALLFITVFYSVSKLLFNIPFESVFLETYNQLSDWLGFIFVLFFSVVIIYLIGSFHAFFSQAVEELKNVNSSLKVSNQNLEKNLEYMPVAVAVAENNKVKFVNQSFTRQFGYSKVELPDLELWQERLFGMRFGHKNDNFGWAPDAFNTGQSYSIRTLYDEEKLVEISTNKVDQKVLICIEDFTERVQSEERIRLNELQLKEQNSEVVELNSELEKSYLILQETNTELMYAKERAEESDELKSAFLANLSHEIRTPMNGIIGFADMIVDMNLRIEQYKRYGQIISNSSMQLLNIMNDIIDISKIEAGQIEILKRDFEVSTVFDDVCSLYEPIAQQKDLDLVFRPQTKEPRYIYSDPTRFRQIIENLVNNAIKFTNEGRVEFGFSIEKDKIRIYVSDTGIGIPEEQKKFVFERFRQVETQVSKRAGGTGLGLSIAKALTEMLGGEISLNSTQGLGSEFFFCLPLEESSKG